MMKFDPKSLSPINVKIIIYPLLFLVYLIHFYKDLGYADSDATLYIANSIFVGPFYPMIIKILGVVVGAENYKWIAIIQFTIGFSLLAYSCSLLAKMMNVMIFIEIFMMPVFLWFYVHNYGVAIFTESLAYPIFILFFTIILRLVIEKNPKDLNLSFILLGLVYSLRAQFITLFPVLAILILFLGLKDRRIFFKPQYFVKLISVLLICFIFPYIYNYFYHGYFTSAKESGYVISNNLLYFAKAEDKNLFTDELTRKIFIDIQEKGMEVHAIKYCDTSRPNYSLTSEEVDLNRKFFSFRGYSKNLIDHELLAQPKSDSFLKYKGKSRIIRNCYEGIEHFKSSSGDREIIVLDVFREFKINDWKQIDPILRSISIGLIKEHFREWTKFSLEIFFSYFGDGIFGKIVFVLSLGGVIYSSYKVIKSEATPYIYYYLLCMIMMYANTLFLSFVAPYSARYVIYNYGLVAVLIFPLLANKHIYYYFLFMFMVYVGAVFYPDFFIPYFVRNEIYSCGVIAALVLPLLRKINGKLNS